MLQYKVEDLTIKKAVQACCLVFCAGLLNWAFTTFWPDDESEGEDEKKGEKKNG